MNQFGRVIVQVIVFVDVCMLAGCGDEKTKQPATAKVSGLVTYKEKPVAGATVTFHPDASVKSPRIGSGTTNAEGKFTISTFGIDDGAVVGSNVVTVKKAEITGERPKMDPNAPIVIPPQMVIKKELPAKYESETTSSLKFEVRANENNVFKIELLD